MKPLLRQRTQSLAIALCLMLGSIFESGAVYAVPEATFRSVVSVLPVWPGKPHGGTGETPGVAPEGSGVVIAKGGKIATAYHVIKPAERVDVRLFDGRVIAAEIVGFDAATDLALLDVEPDLPVFEIAEKPALASRACIISNAYGLDLSITCGVVSALNISNAGFNPVEDFIQTDAAANPGSSGGALVDQNGRLLGMVSAIFGSRAGMNIGVNFAVSSELLLRVSDNLARSGGVQFVSAGWGLGKPSREQAAVQAGVLVIGLETGGAAEQAGVQIGDLLLKVRGRHVKSPRDVLSALALVSPGETADVHLLRNGQEQKVVLRFAEAKSLDKASTDQPGEKGDCPYKPVICDARQAVFPISGFDPIGSSVRIGEKLLVTNRHITANRKTVTIHTPFGELQGKVLPSAYLGDLALIRVDGLPVDGKILKVREPKSLAGPFQTVGADIAKKEVRVFAPGDLIAEPVDEKPLSRLHVTSHMQPGVSGGALIDQSGVLVGIATGGGNGRHEAIPLDDVAELILLQSSPDAQTIFERLGKGLALCKSELEAVQDQKKQLTRQKADHLASTCRSSQNYGLMQEAGDTLGRQRFLEEAEELHLAAIEQVPNSLNSHLSLLTSYQLAGRYQDMIAPARLLLRLMPSSAPVLQRVLQAGVLSKNKALAEEALARLVAFGGEEAVRARRYFNKARSSFE